MRYSKETTILYLSTFILAACSIIYELILAQSLSAVLGNTILRYNVTIGLYCVSLGAGSLLQTYIKKDEEFTLVIVECLLSLFGGLSPVLIIAADKVFFYISQGLQIQSSDILMKTVFYIISHSVIIIIGILSGIELPLLMKLGGRIEKRLSNRMLTTDYIGSFAGALIFPLLLMPMEGLFISALLTGFANSVVALYFIRRQNQLPVVIKFCLPMLSAVLFILFSLQSETQLFIIDNLYLR